MLKQWLSRRPWLPPVITWAAYAAGVVWRWFHLVIWHDPRRFSLPELDAAVAVARRLAQPGYVLQAADVGSPPGNTWLLEFFLRRDPSLLLQVHFNFLISALVPLAIGALGWVAFGKRTAQIAVVVASVYFGLIDCAAYFTPDVHLALVGTLTLASYLKATALAGEPPSPRRTAGFVGLAAVSGLLFSLALALHAAALPAILGFCAVHLTFTRGPKIARRALVLAAFLVAAAPLTATIAARCTAANGGHFCRSTNTTEAHFLLGHYDRIGGVEWHDPARPGDVAALSNQGALQHGFRSIKVVGTSITNQATNAEYAWSWIQKNPARALVFSFEHVWDCLVGTIPWPALVAPQWQGAYLAHFLFLLLVFLPTLIVLVDRLRQHGLLGLLRSIDFALFTPILGVAYAAFVTTGQARQRVPWDGVLIVLGVQLYRRAAPGAAAHRASPAALDEPLDEDDSERVADPAAEAADVAAARRRLHILSRVAGAAVILGVLSGIVWAMPDRHRFRASSGAWGFPAEGTVGSNLEQGLFFHTAEEENPWVEIDLGEVLDIDRVLVENRDDMGADRAIPLVVEIGDAGRSFHEVARRVEVFDHWTATFPKQSARYVRLRVPRKTSFHLKSVLAR